MGTVHRGNEPIVRSDPVQNVPKNRNQRKIDIYSGSSSSAPASPVASGGPRRRPGGVSSVEQQLASSRKTWR